MNVLNGLSVIVEDINANYSLKKSIHAVCL